MLFFGKVEPTVRYHSEKVRNLITLLITGCSTLSSGQFYWGGSLLKGNGGVQRFSQTKRKFVSECKGKRKLNC